jgi:RND superfamily putative drug exporter
VHHTKPDAAPGTNDPTVTAPPSGSGAAAALARAVVRGRWWVLAFWVGVGVIAVPQAARVPDRLDVRGGSLQPTEASRVDALLATRFRQDIGETFLVLVSGPGPFDRRQPHALLDSLGAALRREPYIRDVTSFASSGDTTLLAPDRRTALVLVTLSVARPDSVLKLVLPLRAAARRALAALSGGGAYRAIVTGDTPLERDMLTVTTEDVGRSERRLLPVAGVILLVACGSLLAALLPLAVGFLAIAVALVVIGALATVWPMSIYVLNVATMIGLGVGIDYSLLVLTRFREELERGASTGEAVARTVTTAGVTVAASGLSVAVGFAGLLLTPLVETRSIGIGGLVVVSVAVLLATTLLPAVLLLLGPAVGRRWWRTGSFAAAALWGRWARTLARRPTWALLAGGLVLAGLAVPVARLRVGLPVRHWWPSGTEAGEGLDLLQRIGGVGYVQPVRVVVDWPSGRSAVDPGALRGLRVLSDSLRADPRVRTVQSLVDLRPKISLLEYALLYSDLAAVRAREPAALDRFLSTDRRATRLDVVLADSTSLFGAMDVVRHARRLAAGRSKPLTDAHVLVGGYVAQNVDFQDDLLGRLPLLVGVIFAATALMLGLVFRSLVIPAKAVLVNALSVAATLGLIVLVFQEGPGGTGAIFVAVPVLVFAVVFGLSMDYEVFLLARIKEAFDRTGDTDRATVEGLGVTAGVITSAALLMIAVFGAFAFARVLVIQLLGFGLAVAVLLDATIIRLVLVPAVLHLAGRWNWWPGTRGGRGALRRPGATGGGASA